MDAAADRRPRTGTLQRQQALHDRLVEAADAAIAECGLASLRARSLAETAGCSVGAIYGVVPDLDALVLAVNARTLEALDHTMRGAGGHGAAGHLVALAEAYLDYAAQHRPRWDALFQHRVPDGHDIPPWYAERRAAAFSHIEAPLAVLQPALPPAERALLARTLFSAVHGMVALGLEAKIATMPLPLLRAQIRTVVAALAAGLG